MPDTTPFTLAPSIVADRLSKTFDTHTGPLTLFESLSLEIRSGETVAIIGQSGAGKSTLLSLLAGLDTPTSGNVQLSGVDLSQMSDEERSAWRAKHVGFIFQSFHLLPELSALENVQLPLDIRGEENSAQKAKTLLDQVGLGHRTDHRPAQLSGGEQQRVAIARAFVTEPDILFADEPTGNLDTDTGESIITQLFDLNAKHNTTLILITHDHELARRCSRQFRLAEGTLTEVGA